MSTTENLHNIEIFKEDMKFSAAHFTVFSASERERLHGHNFAVCVELQAAFHADHGFAADHKLLKDKIRSICHYLDEYTLIPLESPFLEVLPIPSESITIVKHARDELIFYDKDIRLLPLHNTSGEELARYILGLLQDDEELQALYKPHSLSVKVSLSPGQWVSVRWQK